MHIRLSTYGHALFHRQLLPHMLRVFPRNSDALGTVSMSAIFKTKYTLHGILVKTRSIRDVHLMKQCVYSIPCDCGKCYIGETSRPLEVHIKEHKYNLIQNLLEKSKLAQHA
jgi:hypothetical protein